MQGRKMKYILCYGDSNTWGCTPETFERYEFHERWPGILQDLLGNDYHVYENALNGRTTVFEDYIEEGRCGKTGLPVVLEANSPLDLVIVMLGTNDCKMRFGMQPWDIGWGMDLLIQYVKKTNYGRSGKPPKILILPPPAMGNDWSGTILGTVFGPTATEKCNQLPEIYQFIADKNQVEFLNIATLAKPGKDCIHFEKQAHQVIAATIAEKVREIFK
jgi:Lysophospholipase L1 and related esterases